MDSPTPSEAETFVDNTMFPNHPATARLMEEFTVDSNPTKGLVSPSVPALYTPAHSRAYVFVGVARACLFALNLGTIGLFVASPDNFLELALFPATVWTVMLVFATSSIPVIIHFTFKSQLKKIAEGVRELPGATRNAVLVEDPVTGEERWMLEPKKKINNTSMGRTGYAVFDVCCGLSILFSLALLIIVGAPKARMLLGWIVAARVLMLLLIAFAGTMTFLLMKVKKTTDHSLENGYD